MTGRNHLFGLFLSSHGDMITAHEALSMTGQDPTSEQLIGTVLDDARASHSTEVIYSIGDEEGERMRTRLAEALGIVIEYRTDAGQDTTREEQLLERIDS